MAWIKLENKPHRFQPGHEVRKPTVDLTMAEVKRVNRQLIEETFACYLTKRYGEVKQINSDDNKPVLDRIVSSVIVHAVNNGDAARLNFLLDRTIGKAKEQIEITAKDFDDTLNQIPLSNIITVAANVVSQRRLPTPGENNG